MRYAPYESEYHEVKVMSDPELLEYFLTRVYEAEEVWTLSNKGETFSHTVDTYTAVPTWPYERYINESIYAALSPWTADAISLDDFMEVTLSQMIDENLMIEIMPQDKQAGCLITPERLYSIFEGMVNAGEYCLDS